MAKAKTENVQTRLTHEEIRQLDKEAQGQPIPVTRAQLLAHVIRKWLEERRDKKSK